MTNFPPRIVQMHIPKCGGTSITHAFSKLYKSEEICPARYEPGLKLLIIMIINILQDTLVLNYQTH